MMNENEKLEQLHTECFALEKEAGIAQPMERAREGRFIPLGALGEDASPDEYFADEFDHFREGARNAYFSVEDANLRKRLIALRQKIDTHVAKSFDADLEAVQQVVSAARRKTTNQPWELAAFWAVGAVAVGYWTFNLVGAIGGAVAGFFIGQGVVANAKRAAQTELEQAENELKQLQKDKQVHALRPECFSFDEEITGKRDEQLDQQSAYANILQAQLSGR